MLITYLKEQNAKVEKELSDIKNVRKVSVEIQTKPEMVSHWVQTKLTAEQITQMEKDLEYQRKLLYEGANEIEKLEQELSVIKDEQTKKEEELIVLQNQAKEIKPNQEEQKVLDLCD